MENYNLPCNLKLRNPSQCNAKQEVHEAFKSDFEFYKKCRTNYEHSTSQNKKCKLSKKSKYRSCEQWFTKQQITEVVKASNDLRLSFYKQYVAPN